MTIDVSKIKAGDTVTVTLNDEATVSGVVHQSGNPGTLHLAAGAIVLRCWNGKPGFSVKSIDDWQPKAPEWHTDHDVIAVTVAGKILYRTQENLWKRLGEGRSSMSWQQVDTFPGVSVYARRV